MPSALRPWTLLATASILVLSLSGCATRPTPEADLHAATAANPEAQRAALSSELAKADMRQRVQDDAFWERTLDLPRAHPKFAAFRAALTDIFANEDMLTWWVTAMDVVAQYPGVTVGDLYARFVNNGLMRLDDTQASQYLQSRAAVMARLNDTQCAQYHQGQIPNREVWSVAATLDDQEIKQYYKLERQAFQADLQGSKMRSLPSPQDIQSVQGELQRRFKSTAKKARTAGDMCKTLADWMTSFESFPGTQRSAAITIVLSRWGSQQRPSQAGDQSATDRAETATDASI